MNKQPACPKTRPSTNQGRKAAHFRSSENSGQCGGAGVLTELPDTTQHTVTLGFQPHKNSFSSINMPVPPDNTCSHLRGETSKTRGSRNYFFSLFFFYPKLEKTHPLPRIQKQRGPLVRIFAFFHDWILWLQRIKALTDIKSTSCDSSSCLSSQEGRGIQDRGALWRNGFLMQVTWLTVEGNNGDNSNNCSPRSTGTPRSFPSLLR